MLSLLEAAKPFVNSFAGIRISTRPDYIDNEILGILKSYGVTAIELGAQSMDNSVLELNERGHSASDVENAAILIKEYGFSLGLQMMTGLYGSDFEKDMFTAREFVRLRPDTVRIYPTVIMNRTKLADYYLNGLYAPYTLGQSVELCSRLILLFEEEKIKIIRLGLHCTDSLLENSFGGNYHPAFKELCESRIFYDKFIVAVSDIDSKNIRAAVNPKSLSKFYGQKKSNLRRFADLGYSVSVCLDDSLDKYELRIEEENET